MRTLVTLGRGLCLAVALVAGGYVARVVLDRPGVRDAVDGDFATSLEQVVRETEAAPDVRAVILTGRGPGSARGRADLAEVAAGREAAPWAENGGFAGFVTGVGRKPWLAAVQGRNRGHAGARARPPKSAIPSGWDDEA